MEGLETSMRRRRERRSWGAVRRDGYGRPVYMKMTTFPEILEKLDQDFYRDYWRSFAPYKVRFFLDGTSSLESSYWPPYHLGCESYHYANNLRHEFTRVKMLDIIECKFRFSYDLNAMEKDRDSRSICPIFVKNIYKELLDEMEFENSINFDYIRMPRFYWFFEGVTSNNIPVEYTQLYCLKQLASTRPPTTATRPYQDDPIRFSLHIIKYAFDLLTNFQNKGFTFVFDPHSLLKTMTVSEAYSINKPDYEVKQSVFEKGWSELSKLRLFEHFLKETIQLVDLQILDRLPEDARLLLIALVYFSRKKQVNCSADAASILLSYVTLSVVLEKCDSEKRPLFPCLARPALGSSADNDAATVADCNTAAAIMSDYLSFCKDVDPKLDREIVYPLEEFQYCLLHLNYLNVLCGRPVAPTVFHRTYAGSLVFRLRCALKAAGDVNQFLRTLLSPAPTVLAFISSLMEAYEEMLLTCQ